MQVLGDLLRLPDGDDLPLPWWHRATLGLKNGTWCYVALVESSNRPVADLIVSVLKPTNWDHMFRVRCTHPDEPGVISKAIETFRDYNIALAESVTIDAGALHEITLFCEAVAESPRPLVRTAVRKRLKELGFDNVAIDPFEPRPVNWNRKVEVKGGWIKNVAWRAEMERRYANSPTAAAIDFSKAVVSADTTSRVIRFTFPYKNARTIRIEHLDEPRVLKTITDVLFQHQLNLLSTLLRRGGAKPGNAMLVAVYEPRVGSSASSLFESVERGIKDLPPKLMIEFQSNDGIPAHRTISPKEQDSLIARIPSSLVDKVLRVRSNIPTKLFPVFFSRRFVKDPRVEALEHAIRNSVRENGGHILEASPQTDISAPNLIFTEVSANMWVAQAGIVLITGLKSGEPLGRNLPHEFGFLQGQAKPILLLVESGLTQTQSLWSNIDGVYAPRFPTDEVALLPARDGSIHHIITQWFRQLRKLGYGSDR